jgi:hypothetical protein
LSHVDGLQTQPEPAVTDRDLTVPRGSFSELSFPERQRIIATLVAEMQSSLLTFGEREGLKLLERQLAVLREHR